MSDTPLNNHHPASKNGTDNYSLLVSIMSFGYKEGQPPLANLVFDVRFLKNPFWVEELRPLTGCDAPVQEYVMQQPLATEFLKSVVHMLDTLLPKLEEQNIAEFTIAFGCTGGQHRSATMVETLASEMNRKYPHYRVKKLHRELHRKKLLANDTGDSNHANDKRTAQALAQQLKAEE